MTFLLGPFDPFSTFKRHEMWHLKINVNSEHHISGLKRDETITMCHSATFWPPFNDFSTAQQQKKLDIFVSSDSVNAGRIITHKIINNILKNFCHSNWKLSYQTFNSTQTTTSHHITYFLKRHTKPQWHEYFDIKWTLRITSHFV